MQKSKLIPRKQILALGLAQKKKHTHNYHERKKNPKHAPFRALFPHNIVSRFHANHEKVIEKLRGLVATSKTRRSESEKIQTIQ